MSEKMGRPFKFKTPEELQAKIDDYFNHCIGYEWGDVLQRDESGEVMRGERGAPIYKPEKKEIFTEVPTITGLAMYIDTTRDLLCDYEDLGDFSDTIKKAKQKIRTLVERDLTNRGNAGDIFRAKNFGWKDKQEIEHSGSLDIGGVFGDLRK